MKCITINNHDYANRAYGNPTADAAIANIMRERRINSKAPPKNPRSRQRCPHAGREERMKGGALK